MTTTNFQTPKGTRDFYPAEMAVRRYLEDVWRRVSIRHGFLEVDGPTFETLDLYKIKSGEEIVSQLFSFTDRGGRELALRPEFTPTLARMVAERAAGLPRPIKWFSISRCYRAEQPQKGRLREFMQWNVDFIGEASERADGECLALCADALGEFGLGAGDYRIGWNHRGWLNQGLTGTFVAPERLSDAYYILDRLEKLDAAGRRELFTARKCSAAESEQFELIAQAAGDHADTEGLRKKILASWPPEVQAAIAGFERRLAEMGLADFCRFDLGVVRGLAYYTGFVFEIIDRQGENRAIAGGGRYDQLIELFGGPALPAVGFGMGDVVLEILLRDRQCLPQHLLPAPEVFIVNALEDPAPADRLIFTLRRSQRDAERGPMIRPGLHVDRSYRSTRNIGKLLQEAAASGAKLAVILAANEYGRGLAKLKNLTDRTETEVALAALPAAIHAALSH